MTEFLFQIRALSINVWREAVRDRLVQLLVGFGFALMLVSLAFGEMAVGGGHRILQSMGFWIMGIWGLLAVLYLGSNVIRNELQRKTVYLVLSRPINRTVFLIGKFIGMILVLLTTFALLSLGWLVLLQLFGVAIGGMHFIALIFIFAEWVLLAALSLFFASFTSPILHNFFLVGITFLGHWSNDLRLFSENAKSVVMANFLKVIYHILPNLESLNFREAALYDETVAAGLIWQGAGVLILWMALFLVAANLVFVRRRLL